MKAFAITAWILALSLPLLAQEAPQAQQKDDEDEHYTELSHKIVWPDLPEPEVGAPDATLSIYFDLVNRTRSRAVNVNEPFEFYLVARDPHVAVLAWEATVTADAPLRIIEEDFEGINVGGNGEFRVSRQPPDCLVGAQVVLAKFKGLLLEEGHSDLVIHLGPVRQATMRDPDRPAYVMCRQPLEARPFAFEAVAAVVNPAKIQLKDERPAADLFKPVRGGND